MKRFFALFFALFFAALASGQTIEDLPRPADVERQYRREYRQDLSRAAQEVENLTAGQWEIIIDEMERVDLTPYVLTIDEAQAAGNESWGSRYLLPDDLRQELRNRFVYPVDVKIYDTGIDPSHEAFAGYNFMPRQEFTSDPYKPALIHPHGTHVFGIVAQVLHDQIVAGLVTPGDVRVLGTKGQGSFSWLETAVRDNRIPESVRRRQGVATVSNMSLGATTDPIQGLADELQLSAIAGSYFVVSAGNTGQYTKQYPASDPNTIATGSLDENGRPSSFTTKGDFVNNAMPGGLIRSTIPGNKYATYSGTSMASPFETAAAVVALGVYGIDALPNQTALANYFSRVAQDIQPAGRDDATGWGINLIRLILATPPRESDSNPGDDPSDPPGEPILTEFTFTMPIAGRGYIMRWARSTGTGYESPFNILSVPDMICECTTQAQRIEIAYDQCTQTVDNYFTNRAIIGVNNANSATYWSGRFLEMLDFQIGLTEIEVKEIRGLDEYNRAYLHFDISKDDNAPQAYDVGEQVKTIFITK